MKTALTLAAVLGALSLTAYAQDGGGPPQDGPGGPGGPGGQGGPGMGGHRHPIPAIVTALDTNHDGIIDADEIANASAALKTLDKNGDGKLTRDEFMGKPPGRPPMQDNGGSDDQAGPGGQGGLGGPGGGPGGPGMGGHRPLPAIIAALDANHDGVIDADEIANASVALKTLDKNGDGKLTRDEYMGKPPGRPPGGGEGQGGGANNDGPQGPPPGN